MNVLKGIKLEFICIKMKLIWSEKYLQQRFSRNVLVPETTTYLRWDLQDGEIQPPPQGLSELCEKESMFDVVCIWYTI